MKKIVRIRKMKGPDEANNASFAGQIYKRMQECLYVDNQKEISDADG